MASARFFMFFAIFVSSLHVSFSVPSFFYFPENITATWTNNNQSFSETILFSDGSIARFILLEQERVNFMNEYGFGSCFYCRHFGDQACYFAVVFVEMVNRTITMDKPPVVVWSANGDSPVRENATLKFSVQEGLVLVDENGETVWSSGSTDASVSGMRMTAQGNLVLLNRTKGAVWQSFDYPTDTLLVGQILREDQWLNSSTSPENLSSGPFFLNINYDALAAYVYGNSSTLYVTYKPHKSTSILISVDHIEFSSDKVIFYMDETNSTSDFSFPNTACTQFMRLDPDGGIRIYGWRHDTGWQVIYVLLDGYDECQFPLKCGRYGLCAKGQCTCPTAIDGENYFRPVDGKFPSLGCEELVPVPFQETQPQYRLVDFGALSYFSYAYGSPFTGLHDEDSCKQACLTNPSCKAAFFAYDDYSQSYCYLPSEIFSIIGTPMTEMKNTSCHIKVCTFPTQAASQHKIQYYLIIFMIALVVLGVYLLVLKVKQTKIAYREEIIMVPDNLVRFSYVDLLNATGKFSQVVGRGGFGTVFRGVLPDGSKVAVKKLESMGQGVKEFMAEVNTIGNKHHINLVRLIGFCFDSDNRMLVYEYMSNGSLDTWIFGCNNGSLLDWKTRKKILLDVAKGLAYLHEDCRQKVAHLDIKPHNILLDDEFNAKLSDFGMSKLMHRNENEVVTLVRGTLGYIAPEWQHSRITVKADVYSFGVVVLEVVSGRKIFDYSQPNSEIHLLHVLKKKTETNELMEIIDRRCVDTKQNGEDVMFLLRLGMWCLSHDYNSRPSMSSVVKVLEGNMELDTSISCNFRSFLSPTQTNSKVFSPSRSLSHSL